MQRRLPLVLLIVVLLAALLLFDHAADHTQTSDEVAQKALMPVASPPGAVSSAFFCAGGGATAGKIFDSTVVIANPGTESSPVLVTTYPAALPSDNAGKAAVAALKPVTKQLQVGARSRAEVHLADLQASPFAAAVVETNDSDIAVEHRVVAADGTYASSSPCASSPSTTWYFPTGTTTLDATELLAVFNPFPVDAVVDVSFRTSDGFRQPSSLTAVPIPGGSLQILDISASVPRIEQLSGTVQTRSGTVIVDRLQSFDGTAATHPAGLAATLGAPAGARVWTFPEGELVDGLNQVFTLMNPSDDTATVQLEVTYDDPDTNGKVDPIVLSLQPHSYTPVSMRDQTRILQNVPFSVTARSTSGTDVIVERVITSTAPAPRRGYAPALGAPLVATRWVFADGRAVANQSAEFVIIVNPSTSVARLKFGALASGQLLEIDGLQDVEVPAGGRVAVELGLHVNRPDLSLIVDADAPIVAERGLYAADGKGISLASGIPLSEDATLPPSG